MALLLPTCSSSVSACLPAIAISPPLQKPICLSASEAVLVLADRHQLAAHLDQPAVAGRVGGAEPDHHDGGPGRELGARVRQAPRPRSAACRRTSPECRHSPARSPRAPPAPRVRFQAAAPARRFRPRRQSAPQPCAPLPRRARPPARHRPPPAAFAAAATCATIGRPAISCSTFGFALFMRVPSPAARMIDRQDCLGMLGFRLGGSGTRGCSSTPDRLLQSCHTCVQYRSANQKLGYGTFTPTCGLALDENPEHP